jgi:hypothetical protein
MKAMITASNSHQLVKQRRHWQRLKENKIVVVFRYVCCVFICTRMKKCCDRVRFCDEHLKAKKHKLQSIFHRAQRTFLPRTWAHMDVKVVSSFAKRQRLFVCFQCSGFSKYKMKFFSKVRRAKKNCSSRKSIFPKL